MAWWNRKEQTATAVEAHSSPPEMRGAPPIITGDNPIKSTIEDSLGRYPSARSFARHLLRLDASEGFVVGVMGPWGSGKTSFVNLARQDLVDAEVLVLDFNPWMFSGAEQLVTAFFDELSSQLKPKAGLSAAAESLEAYGDALSGLDWVPVAGGQIKSIGALLNLLSEQFRKRDRGLAGRRERVVEALRSLTQPLVVVIDDIDRLTTSEIRDIFKLVRLTASFPNVVYVLAFDRGRVENALNEEGFKGRSYLEKILQIGIDLPATPEQAMHQQIFSELDKALSTIENRGAFDEGRWPDVFVEIIRPLISNMRDVRRYVAAVHGTVLDLNGQTSLVDVLGVEAVRIFLPDVFAKLHMNASCLTNLHTARDRDEVGKQRIEAIVSAGAPHEDVVRAVIRRIFPAAEHYLGGTFYSGGFNGNWFKNRRLAHGELLSLYLERVAGDGLQSLVDAEKAFSLLADESAFDGFLRSLERNRLEDVVAALEMHESDFTEDQIVPATTVLLNLLPEIPERQRGFFELDERRVIGRVVYRLLRTIDDEAGAQKKIQDILSGINNLSSKLELISSVGHREGSGHKFVSKDAASVFERDLRAEIRDVSVESLVGEKDLLWLLLLTKRETTASEDRLVIPNDSKLTLAILRSSRSESKSQSDGSRAITRSARLAWTGLVELFEDENELRAHIEASRHLLPPDDELLSLADKYLSGWRPDHYGE